MLIIVGLGNPSEEYENTFHNMGFKAIEGLADNLGKKIKKSECKSLTSSFSVKGEKIILAKPQTYMNLSGEAVASLLKKNEADISELVVIYDDIDIDRYTVRARSSGSAGTHNGMKSIVSNLCSSDFKRIRIGIGRGQGELRDFVLSQIPKEETDKFKESIAVISDALQKYIHDRDFEKLMRQVNTKPQTK
ncbi:MAG: Peptidyl-tRNA hydrolase [Firmicutes bacterium ADurb.Bin080]|jgi:peptidyl-tRNA hydrolase, PTH1 family|nr:MAG: Peptidyl-tRNA hydrolase [Firmicutes bacterium ADurb.Bin080]